MAKESDCPFAQVRVPRKPMSQRSWVPLALSIGLCGIGIIPNSIASDWPQWRGLNRDGHTVREPALSSLPSDPKPLWKKAVGPGFSSPVVSGDQLVYLDEQSGEETVHLLSARTGEEVWSKPFSE